MKPLKLLCPWCGNLVYYACPHCRAPMKLIETVDHSLILITDCENQSTPIVFTNLEDTEPGYALCAECSAQRSRENAERHANDAIQFDDGGES